MVAGDLSPVKLGKKQDDRSNRDAAIDSALKDDLPNLVVTDVPEGLTNNLWEAIKTLVMTVAFQFPQFDFEDISAEEEMLNSLYLRRVLGPKPRGCQAIDHFRLALIDYLISGHGFVSIGFENGRPTVEYCDSLDLTWDQSRVLNTEAQWISRKVRRPLYYWQEMFGDSVADKLQASGKDTHDNIFELEWYYDIEGEGHHYIMMADRERPVTIIEQGPNPFRISDGDWSHTYLPIESMFFMHLPSVRFATGIVQNMLPHHLAVVLQERQMRETIKRGAPQYAVNEGALEESSLERFISGELGEVLEKKTSGPAVEIIPGLEIRQTDMLYKQHHEEKLTAMSGANPYAGGQRVAGVEYAAEVQQIASSSNLTASSIANDYTGFIQRTVQKVLLAGFEYDRSAYQFKFEGVTLNFNQENPIQHYLQPDAVVIVRQDASVFKTDQQKISESLMGLKTAMELAERYPGLVDSELRAFLRARGVKNIEGYLGQAAQPQAAPDAAQMQGQDPTGMAAESLTAAIN